MPTVRRAFELGGAVHVGRWLVRSEGSSRKQSTNGSSMRIWQERRTLAVGEMAGGSRSDMITIRVRENNEWHTRSGMRQIERREDQVAGYQDTRQAPHGRESGYSESPSYQNSYRITIPLHYLIAISNAVLSNGPWQWAELNVTLLSFRSCFPKQRKSKSCSNNTSNKGHSSIQKCIRHTSTQW